VKWHLNSDPVPRAEQFLQLLTSQVKWHPANDEGHWPALVHDGAPLCAEL
jgi:hypothetical protein